MGQGGRAAHGRRQRQGRNGHAPEPGLRRHLRRPERRPHGVGDRHRHLAGGDAPVAADRMADGDGVVDHVLIPKGDDGDGLNVMPVRGGKDQGVGDTHTVAGRGHGRHHHVAGGGGVQRHGIRDRAAFGHVDRGREDDPGPRRDDDQPEPTEPVVVSFGDGVLIHDELGSGDGDGRRRGGKPAERGAGALARGEGGRGRDPAGNPPDQIDGQWRRLPHPRPELAVQLPRQVNAQIERGAGVAVQVESLHVQSVEEAVRQGCKTVGAHGQGVQPRPVEDPLGQGRQVGVEQEEPAQLVLPPENRGGQVVEVGMTQTHTIEPQPGEDVFGQGAEPSVEIQSHGLQTESGEVAASERGDVLLLQVQRDDSTQLVCGHRLTGAAGVTQNRGAHLRGAEADVGRIDRDGERKTVLVAVAFSGRPGIGARRRHGGRRGAGDGACFQCEAQPGGQVAVERVGRGSVAADGLRQRQRRDGGVQHIALWRDGHVKLRRDVGRHRHGKGLDRGIAGRRVGVGIRDGPGQGHGRDPGRGAGQDAPVRVDGQVVGNGIDGGQGVAQGAVAARRGRQGQGRNDLADHVVLGGNR